MYIKQAATEKQFSTLSQKPIVVIFDAYRNTPYSDRGTIITYEGLHVNEGNAMNPNTVIFTAPLKGIYTFSFHAMTDRSRTYIEPIRIRLQVNGQWKATTEHHGQAPSANFSGAIFLGVQIPSHYTHMLAMSVILELKANDKVSCWFQTGGGIADWKDSMITHFTGHLLALK